MQDHLRVLASPIRRQILRLLLERELNAGEIQADFAISWPAISQHLRVLRDSELVTERREGRHRFYRVNRKALGPLSQLLEEE